MLAEFETGCMTYDGPHSRACYLSTWKKVGCIDNGGGNPSLTSVSVEELDRFNLKWVNVVFDILINISSKGAQTCLQADQFNSTE